MDETLTVMESGWICMGGTIDVWTVVLGMALESILEEPPSPSGDESMST